MTARTRLQRPKSTIFASAENKMKRLTNFLGNEPTVRAVPSQPHDGGPQPLPTPPLGPDMKAASGSPPPLSNRTLAPTLSVTLPPPTFNPPQAPVLYKQQNNSTGNLLTPTSATTARGQALPPFPPLQAPVAPFATSRPSSRGSLFSNSRPGTPSSLGPGLSAQPAEIPRVQKKRKGRFGKKKNENHPLTWRLAAGSTASLESYDVGPLLRGEPATDLWYPDGDTLVYLTSRDNPNPKYAAPAFRIHSSPLLFNALSAFVEDVPLEHPKMFSGTSDSANGTFAPNDLFLEVPVDPGVIRSAVGDDATTVDPSQLPEESDRWKVMYKVYYPVLEIEAKQRPATSSGSKKSKLFKRTKEEAEDTLQIFLDARNLFAFLSRNFLAASVVRSTPYDIFSKIYLQLGLQDADQFPGDMHSQSKIYMAESHLQTYMDELRFDDCRNDDDAIVESLILGERWHSMRLLHEGFLHACGKWEDVKHHPAMSLVSANTKTRLDRSYIDLTQYRLDSIRTRIPNFDFPAVWRGEGRYKEFDGWKNGYHKMRALVLHHVKWVFGSWPPRAGKRGKGGGHSETGGLNRIVLKRLYDDLCCIYDLIVDRDWLQGERIHFEGPQKAEGDAEKSAHAREKLLKILGEFDTSAIPVQPEMPFSLPRIPYKVPSPNPQKKKTGIFSRLSNKLDAAEMAAVVDHSYNEDSLKAYSENALVKAFRGMEIEFGTGKTIEEAADARRGRWVFLYCVLQSLPMVVVDATGLLYGDCVEYFLCERYKGLPPWDKGANRRNARMSALWTAAPDGSLMNASTSNLAIPINADDDVDVTYRCSHCWMAAEQWRLFVSEDTAEPQPVGYNVNGEPVYEGEYVPGQQLQPSPTENDFPGEHVPYYDSSVAGDFHKLQLDERQSPLDTAYSARISPAWAQEARANYQYGAAQYGIGEAESPTVAYGDGRSLTPSQVPLPVSPVDDNQNVIQPLQIQPFDFDLGALETKPTLPLSLVAAPESARRGSQSPIEGPRRQSPPRGIAGPAAARGSPVGAVMRHSSLPGHGRSGTGYSSPAYSSPYSTPKQSPHHSPAVGPKRVSSMPTHVVPLHENPTQSPGMAPVPESSEMTGRAL